MFPVSAMGFLIVGAYVTILLFLVRNLAGRFPDSAFAKAAGVIFS